MFLYLIKKSIYNKTKFYLDDLDGVKMINNSLYT